LPPQADFPIPAFALSSTAVVFSMEEAKHSQELSTTASKKEACLSSSSEEIGFQTQPEQRCPIPELLETTTSRTQSTVQYPK